MAKNIADMCIGVLAFYAVGYAFAHGDGGGWFIGGNFISQALTLRNY